ncbi:MAG TPA: extensin-like protein, partial [Myxococcaceae bacterium]|nr:extensin-like protein [Myxococcaceae bacterium]
MKTAFEQNVSRAKPRLRLGAFTGVIDPAAPEESHSPEQALAQESAPEQPAALEPTPAPEPPALATANDLSAEVRARVERARAPRPTAAEVIEAALHAAPAAPVARVEAPE